VGLGRSYGRRSFSLEVRAAGVLIGAPRASRLRMVGPPQGYGVSARPLRGPRMVETQYGAVLGRAGYAEWADSCRVRLKLC
jgi:hypothetical protein